MAWLFDTNVLPELRKPVPNPSVSGFVSIVALAELEAGLDRVLDTDKQAALRHWLDSTIIPVFADSALVLTIDVLRTWLAMVDRGQKAGHTFAHAGSLIAATALHQRLTVVTGDVANFERAGCQILNPWT